MTNRGMRKLKVVNIDGDSLVFDNGATLSSSHDQDCCESHYLNFSELNISDFDGLEFNLEDDFFFKKVEGYGVELIPLKGHPVRVAGYGYNNGYYGTNIDLVFSNGKITKTYDVSECQKVADE